MNLVPYIPQYQVEIVTYDNELHVIPIEGFDALKAALNSDKFIQIKDSLIAVSSIKKVSKALIKSASKAIIPDIEKTFIPKELIEKQRQYLRPTESNSI